MSIVLSKSTILCSGLVPPGHASVGTGLRDLLQNTVTWVNLTTYRPPEVVATNQAYSGFAWYNWFDGPYNNTAVSARRLSAALSARRFVLPTCGMDVDCIAPPLTDAIAAVIETRDHWHKQISTQAPCAHPSLAFLASMCMQRLINVIMH